jgi:hypothetical protein
VVFDAVCENAAYGKKFKGSEHQQEVRLLLLLVVTCSHGAF